MELSSLQKGLLILKELAASERAMSVPEIAHATGLNRSTTYRLCEVLEARGWVTQMPSADGQRAAPYDLGSASHGLAVLIANKYDTVTKLEPLVEGLSRSLDETVHVGMLEHDKIVHVARGLPADGPSMAARIGSRQPAHATGLGKAMLATLSRDALDQLYVTEMLPTRGPNTIATRSELYDELALVVERGYAFDDEEARPGVRCIAAPIFAPDGRAGLAISITTMTVRLATDARVAEVAQAVIGVATLATAAFGGRAPEGWGTKRSALRTAV